MGILPTELHCRNVDVDAINLRELAVLPGCPLRSAAADAVLPPDNANLSEAAREGWAPPCALHRERLEASLASCRAPGLVQLKRGAQVMLLLNNVHCICKLGHTY